MKKNKVNIILLFLMILTVHIVQAQRFGNEWIVQGQQYLKMTVAEDGIYRIERQDLINAGFPVPDPRRMQVFHRGEELPIFFNGQEDGVFNDTDYIEFFGHRADGTTDTELYVNPSAQPHTLYNLFSDSSAYFLTFRLDATNGLRMESRSENNVSGIPEDEYYLDESIALFTNSYYEGESYGGTNETVLSQYDFYEGWTGSFVRHGQTIDVQLQDLTNTFQEADNPRLEILLAGGNNNGHNVDISVGTSTSSLRNIGTAIFNKDENELFTSDIFWSDISSSGELTIRATVNGVNGQADRVAISYVRLIYPRNYDIQEQDRKSFILRTESSDKSFIRIINPISGSHVLDITDRHAPIRIGSNSSFQEINAVVPGTSIQRKIWLQASQIKPTFQNITFDLIDPPNYNYIILTNDSLRRATTSGTPDPVLAYQNYRQSEAGGSHKVYLADIDQVFDQYNYGEKSPVAVRRFLDYLLDQGDPLHLFIIGRSTSNGLDYYRRSPEADTTIKNFVPNYGHPGSDDAFSVGLNGTSLEPAIATGRINAKNPDDVEAYLNKIIEAESQPYNDLWHKNLIHLSGGRTEQELNNFKSFIDEFKAIAEGPLLGGSVVQNSKNTNSEVEFFNISEEVNKGVSVITFFGHSSASVTDIEVGLVSNPAFGYSNTGRYPVFIVNGCNAGDFFGSNESFGVDWLLTPDLGAIGFMAHSSIAFSGNLRRYTNLFYNVNFAEEQYFSETLGTVKKEVSRRFVQQFGSNPGNATQVQQFILQGDPALKIFSAELPDYDITENNIDVGTFNGSLLIASIDSFFVDIDIKNYGKFDAQTLDISLRRTLQSGSIIEYGPVSYDPILRQDTVRFTVDNRIEQPQGNNTFEIILDETDLITELDETNNSASFDLFLADGSTFNILPADFAIVSNTTVDFVVQSTNVLTGLRQFLIEIDTSIQFNSPFLLQSNITSDAAASLSINLEQNGGLADNSVVYWRSKFGDPREGELDEWVVSSFTLDRNESTGWKQQSNDQLNSLNKNGLNLDVNTGVWTFPSNDTQLNVTTFGPNVNNPNTIFNLDGQNFFLTSSTEDPGCRNNSINIVAFDQQSTSPYVIIDLNTPDVRDDRICGKIPQIIYNFTAPEFNNAFNPELLIDNINDNDPTLIFSLGHINYSSWTNTFKDQLVSLGFDRNTLNNLEDGEPLIMFGRKGTAEGMGQIVTTSILPKEDQSISLNSTISGSFFSGSLITQNIGPALGFSQFTNDLDISNNNVNETYSFDIIGVDKNNSETSLISNVQDNLVDLSGIDANQFPGIKIRFQSFDDEDLTPPQLNAWTVNYQEAPEGILLKRSKVGLESAISIDEGQPLDPEFTFWNVSNVSFSDSVKIRFDLLNNNSAQLFPDSLMIAPTTARDSIIFSVNINTVGKNGVNDLIVQVNPDAMTEVHKNNNILRLKDFIDISPDDTNPILEVSFDGIFILDGDIISPNPNILVRVKDENEFLFKDDTTGINMFFRHPCDGCEFERIAFSDPNVTWTSATANSDFNVQYSPKELSNGLYGLRVQATDETGNLAGTQPYEINFEVVNESTITNFYPYPNPFSSSVRFVFTLTGSEIPTDLKIQIMTVTGRVVREILRDELGPINIGNNITEFAWDGRDNYGDQLANGVYLYRVIIKNDGTQIERRETSADKAFKNGYGKLYLLR